MNPKASHPRRVLIVGGGIGGLTAALMLHRSGHDVLVCESVKDIRPLGVGINLLPHATPHLIGLGLRETLESTAILTNRLSYHSSNGIEIWNEPRGLDAGYEYPQYSIHRGRLQMILLDAVKQRLGPDRVLTGRHFAGLDQDSEGVTAHFVGKLRGEPTGSYSCDLLIGADGLMSRVRELFYPDQGKPHFSGLMLWRGVTEFDPFMNGRSMIMAGNNALKFVAYPICAETALRGRSLINWIAERRVGVDCLHEREDWNRIAIKSDFAPYFADWDFGWLNVPKLIADSAEVFEFPMIDRDPVSRWSFGRVTLLGDAAHPMYPNGSNGAAQAILDCAALEEALHEARSVEESLKAYEEMRLPPTAKIVLDNRETGPERVMQMVEDRCGGRCHGVHTCIPRDELEAISARYKRIAGFAKTSVVGGGS